MSHYSTEDFEDYESDYDTESLHSNDSYESSFIDDSESIEDDTEDEFQFR